MTTISGKRLAKHVVVLDTSLMLHGEDTALRR